jgi:signal transduction histidine kinase
VTAPGGRSAEFDDTGAVPVAPASASTYRRRAVVATASLATLAALALLLAAALAFEDTSDAAVNRVLRTRADGVVAEARGLSTGPTPVVRGLPDPDVVVYDAEGRVAAGSPPAELAGLYARLARSPRDRLVNADTVRQGELKVLARRFVLSTGAVGVVVVAEPLEAYADEQQDALLVAALAGVVIVVVTTVAAAWVSRRVLAPVASMALTAQEWSEHDLDRRFDLGGPVDKPRNEIQALGHTLDGLLDKVTGAILAEQRLTSELAHELRTPLTTVAATAELMAARTDLDEDLRADVEEVRASCRAMAATITGLLEVARASSTVQGRCDLGATVTDAVRALGGTDRTVVDVPPVTVAAPPHLTTRAIAPIIDNALRRAEHVTVTARAEGDRVHVVVGDDGPGVGATDPFGSRGLGLPLARRVARSLGGDVHLLPDDRGARFEVVLPAVV